LAKLSQLVCELFVDAQMSDEFAQLEVDVREKNENVKTGIAGFLRVKS
jgi:hypothetical protein